MLDTYEHVIDDGVRAVLSGEDASWGGMQRALQLSYRAAADDLDDDSLPDELVYRRVELVEAADETTGDDYDADDRRRRAAAVELLRRFWLT